MDRSQQTSANLMDSHDRLIADILTRYRTLTMLSTIQSSGEATNEKPETIAVMGISMKMEFDGLYASIKDLLTLSRKMKELWLFGPIGNTTADRLSKEARLGQDVAAVESLMREFETGRMKRLAESSGGTWEGADLI